MDHVLVGDLGGTSLRLGLGERSGRIFGVGIQPTTHEGATTLVDQILDGAQRAVDDARVDMRTIVAMGMGVPGVCNSRNGEIERADNVPGLNGFPLAEKLAASLGLPVFLENDVNLAAVGERWHGTAAGVDDFVFLAIGSGTGMGAFVAGSLLTGATGAAGEVAYLPLGADPFDPDVRRTGAYTTVASGSALARTAQELRPRYSGTSVGPGASTAEVFLAAERGDPLGLAIVHLAASLVAQGITAVAAVLDPDLIVLGGGVGRNPLLLEPVRDLVRQSFPYPLSIEPTALGDLAGLHGALSTAIGRLDAAGRD